MVLTFRQWPTIKLMTWYAPSHCSTGQSVSVCSHYGIQIKRFIGEWQSEWMNEWMNAWMNDRKNERMKERRENTWMNEWITFSKWTRNSAPTRTHPLGTQAQRYRPPIRLGCRISIIYTRAINVHSKYIILPVLVHLSRRLKYTIVIRRPSVRPSVVRRLSSLTFSLFRLLLWNHWREFNNTWQEAISQHPLPSLCFSGRSKKQDGRPGRWLADTFSTFPLKLLNGIQRNLTGSKISTSSTKFLYGLIGKTRWPLWRLTFFTSRLKPLNGIQQILTESNITTSSNKFVFFGPIGKLDCRPGLWLAGTFSTSPLKPLNRILQNLIGSKISTSSTKFVFFGPTRKLRWPPLPLIGWDIFDFASETAEQN